MVDDDEVRELVEGEATLTSLGRRWLELAREAVDETARPACAR